MIFTTLLRTFFLLISASLQLQLRSTSSVSLMLLASASMANAYALFPEMANAHKRDYYSTPCSYETEVTGTTEAIGTVESANIAPVTVTVTVHVPPASSTSASVTTSNSTGTSTTASSTTSSATSTPTVDALVLIAQQAQQLNAEFQSLTTGDACTPGQRACIDSKTAQCSTPQDGSAPQWVTLACSVGASNDIPLCAALPPPSLPSASNTGGSTSSNSASFSATVELGCFTSSTIQQRFSDAGVQGGMFPPGFASQTSKARASKDKKAGDKLPVGALLLLLTVIIMG